MDALSVEERKQQYTKEREYDDTRQAIALAMTESTGTHFLDSGGAYGRAWQRNQGRDFMAEPYSTLSFKYGLAYTLNTFHWLAERVNISERDIICAWYSKVSGDSRFEDADNLAFILSAYDHSFYYDWDWDKDDNRTQYRFHRFIDNLIARGLPDDFDASEHIPTIARDYCERWEAGPHGTGCLDEMTTVNTYNDQNSLDATLQFILFSSEHNTYALIQFHGGCDVRGGYTRAYCFEASCYGDIEYLLSYADGRICCDTCSASWYTDDSYHWYSDGSHATYQPTIEQSTLPTLGDIMAQPMTLQYHDLKDYDLDDFINEEDDTCVCPCCERGKLIAG